MKILIIDDSTVARVIMKKVLPDDIELEIQEAGDYDSAISLFESFNPHLTFLDLTMPERSGFEILEEILKIHPKAKIVIVSADKQKHTIEKCMQMGCTAFLPKPPVRADIRTIVETVVEDWKTQRA